MERNKPALSVLIPWFEREELQLTLAANTPLFRTHDAEILILNCGGSSERLRSLISESAIADVRQLDISVPGFNKSLALNAGLAHARADAVFILDADVVLLGPLPVDTLDKSFVTIESEYESAAYDAKSALDHKAAPSEEGPALEFRFRDGVKVRYQLGRRDEGGNVRAGTGLLLATKQDLLDVGGYNSDLDSWGWEDDDVLVRLQYAQRRRVQSGKALHLTHGDNRRFLRGSRDESNQRNFIKCCRNYNKGLFLGTYRADMESLTGKVNET